MPRLIKGTPLQVDGVMYLTAPDHVWALDARTGREIWHHAWQSKGGIHIGNRGAAILGDTLYFETPDCNLVALNIKDGTERWHKQICDLDQFYYGSVAPVIVKNHVIAGVSGDDLDVPGYVAGARSRDRRDAVALVRRAAEEGRSRIRDVAERRSDEARRRHDLAAGHLRPRAESDLRDDRAIRSRSSRTPTAPATTCSPPRSWRSIPTPARWCGTSSRRRTTRTTGMRRRRRCCSTARSTASRASCWRRPRATASSSSSIAPPARRSSRRSTCKTNWSTGYDEKGQPIPNPAKQPQIDGALVSPNQGGAANWPPPSFSPQTGLFYVNATQAFSVYYIYDPGDNPQGWGGTDRGGYSEAMLQAIDYKTGKIKWSHRWEGGSRGRAC